MTRFVLKNSKAVLQMGLAALLMIYLMIPPALAASLTEQFMSSDASSRQVVNHQILDDLLKSHIETDSEGLNRVNYKALKSQQSRLQIYLKQLQSIKVTALNRKEQFAFWANLYNALTLDVVLSAYPVKSIRDIDISPGLFSNGPWGKKLVKIEGTMLSLDDIEHKILRIVFRDPRVHFAVNCASIGCPNLQKHAFSGRKLNQQLNAAASSYINSNRGVNVNNGRLELSKIFSWFQQDFGPGERAVLNYIKTYASPVLKTKLQQASSVSHYFYDWNLNDTAR